MQRNRILPFAGVGAVMLIALMTVSTAFAHERRDVGDYQTVVGFDVEPAYEGIKNAASIRISRISDGEPVPGVQETLQVELTHVPTGKSVVVALRSPFGNPGYYVADFIPTAPGHYRFRFFGKIEGQEVNETYESRTGGGNFGDIEPSVDLQFPESLPEVREVQSAVLGVQSTAQDARDTALEARDMGSGARTLSIIAIVIGALGLAAGGAGIAMARRPR